ncbi:MAG TPA: hypothetical protein VKB95_11335 [Chitinophagaceae bacterium]|nr:hypothetical protein [Chitinophagaceae bacterium]
MKRIISSFLIFQLICFNSFSQPAIADTMVTNVLDIAWMPDGKALCVAVIRSDKARKRTPQFAIFKLDLKTGKTALLIKNASGPGISPDGRKMAYTKRDGPVPLGNTDIYIYDFKTKLEKPIIADSVRESSPSWSPDGKKLVYTVLANLDKGIRYADLNLWVVNIETGEKKEILEANGVGVKMYNPVWAPAGNKIVYYLEKGDGRDQIYITDENGSYQTNLTADTSTHNYYPGWIGNQILYTRSPGKIITMNPDGSQKSIIEKLQTSRAFYNAKTDKIAFSAPFGEQNLPTIKIFDMKTKQVTNVISAEVLNSLEF